MKLVMEGPHHNLLESVARKIAVGVLAQHLSVIGIKISVRRPYFPVAGVLKSQGVSFSRF
jgi:dihydroneopterin aldolase